MKPLYLYLPATPALNASGKRFVKELLREGTYQHPVRPWPEPLKVDEAKIDELVANTMSGLGAGVRVPLPITHDDGADPETNRGFWQRVFKAKNSAGSFSLYGEAEVSNEETAAQVGKELRDVSVYINDFGSGNWTPKGDRIVHACFTNYPVFTGQENFVALSAGGGVESTRCNASLRLSAEPERTSMKITQNLRDAAKTFGVTLAGEDLTETALETLLSAAVAAKAPPSIEAPALSEKDVPRILSVDTKGERYFSAYRAQAEKSVALEVEGAEKAGRLTKPMADAVRSLLSVTHGYGLSAEGAASAVDVPALVRTVLSGIPDRAVVPVTPDPSKSAAGAPPLDPTKFSVEVLADTAKRILSTSKKS